MGSDPGGPGLQITYSALGQAAPSTPRPPGTPTVPKEALRAYAAQRLPDLEVRSGGSTSVDVTRKGIDKAYGARRLMEILDLNIADILFYGDRLDEGGNDRPVADLRITSIAVHGWHDTHARLDEVAQRSRLAAAYSDPFGGQAQTLAQVAVETAVLAVGGGER